MTKADVINAIVDETGLLKKDVTVTVEAMMKVIREAMCQDDNVYLRGFGTFTVKERAAKIARNISKNTSIEVPAHKYPGFKPAKSFIERMRGEDIVSND